MTSVTLLFPNCIVLDAVAIAPYPIAVAFDKLFEETSASCPIAVL